jgi:hypothetical protein
MPGKFLALLLTGCLRLAAQGSPLPEPDPTAALSIPNRMTECEGGQCVPGGGGPGTWVFNGRAGRAVWRLSGAVANLTVERFDSAGVVIRRVDTGGRTPGLTAVYTGKLNGNRIDGDVTWTWPGHFRTPPSGKWYATIDGAEDRSIPIPSSSRASTKAASQDNTPPPRSTAPDKAITTPVFLKDKRFTYDLSGEWRIIYAPNSRWHPVISLVAVVKDGNFQLIVGDPNIFYPIGESMFNGKYADNRIVGEFMDPPAHRGNGYRGYAWIKGAMQVVDGNNLALPQGAMLKRTDGELGANKPCDAVAYAHLDPARVFDYGEKDRELKNFGNAACWYYIAASQGHSEAQMDLGLALHFGMGVKQDYEQSFLWFKKSAGQGWVLAERALAECYESGFGVPKDAALARSWGERSNRQAPQMGQVEREQQSASRFVNAFGNLLSGYGVEYGDRVESYRSRGMNRIDAERAAKIDEGSAEFMHNLMHSYQPPPMPPAR